MGWTKKAASVAVVVAAGVGGSAGVGVAQRTSKPVHAGELPAECSRVIFEGDVRAGEGFEQVFAPGLKFYLEPLRSGWIVRVLVDGAPREAHDYAELATPPYRSVSPLLIGTDWSFRAQDAVAWNPRRFRYAGDGRVFRRLAALYDGVMANDPGSSAKASELISEQPEGLLKILDARLVPGLADQAQMAATVAGHLAETPHTVDQSAAPSPLGTVEEMRFRVEMDLLRGVTAVTGVRAKGLVVKKISCSAPTSRTTAASHQLNK